ncbi:hypothetical protein Aspvir_008538 [Aspergillus viridinutans]|uniref:MFS general substrate transporter n=1 Tax=Aspergillus viridinutans TaxID=75553 RepID=A0A9P3BY81_ASPVI|nr:uncharacterized protein Aspvir_008538 [Aspergillus viridinutans]GIK04455.1 hypothetical protein Aspvir_008538 [Aspergillus viridinutans]
MDEKVDCTHSTIEDIKSASFPPDEIDRAAERWLLWKCDLHVVPILTLLFMFAFLDRINIGNARLMGLERDLGMTGHEYNIALFVFFIPYILFEVPSNMLLKRMRPSWWLSGIMFAWGLLRSSVRFDQVRGRSILLLLINEVADAGQLLAYAINNMDGVAGYSGWRWIFILEGLATIVVAVVSKFIIVDWPETAKFLTEDERALLLRRLSEDQGEARMDRLDKKSLRRAFSDPKIYLGYVLPSSTLNEQKTDGYPRRRPLMYFGIVNTGYAVSFFTPTILNQLGWTAVRAQVMSIPVYCVATVIALSAAYASDRLRHRYLFTLAGCLIATMGYVILLCQASVPIGARYFAVFAITGGGYLTQPILMGWLSNNMAGHYKQSIASAMQIGFGNCGGLVASNIFFKEEAPRYTTRYGVSLGMTWICGAACALFLTYLVRENRLRDAGRREWRLELPQEEVENLGDDHPAFRFTY